MNWFFTNLIFLRGINSRKIKSLMWRFQRLYIYSSRLLPNLCHFFCGVAISREGDDKKERSNCSIKWNICAHWLYIISFNHVRLMRQICFVLSFSLTVAQVPRNKCSSLYQVLSEKKRNYSYLILTLRIGQRIGELGRDGFIVEKGRFGERVASRF